MMQESLSSESCSEGKQKKTGSLAARRRVSKATHTVTYFLQQGHTYSNKATLPNSATLWSSIFKPHTNTHIHTHTPNTF